MKKQSSIELIGEKIKFQMKSVQMDENNGVQWSMSVFYARLNKLLIEAEQAKEIHKQEIIEAHCDWNRIVDKLPSRSAKEYYNETYETNT